MAVGCTQLPSVADSAGGVVSQSGYVPLTQELIQKYGITANEATTLQYYSSKSTQLRYSAITTVRKDTSIRRSGSLSRSQLTSRYSVTINNLTPGVVRNPRVISNSMPSELWVHFDSLLTPVRYVYSIGKTAFDNGYKVVNEPIEHNGLKYELNSGANSLLFIKMDEVDRVVADRLIAKGIKVIAE